MAQSLSVLYDSPVKQYRRAASVLVIRPAGDGIAVLLVHKPRKRDAWQLPQGGIEAGESISEAGLRELKEETGIDLPAVLFESDARYQYDFSKGFLHRYRPKNAGQELLFVVAEAPQDVKVTVDNREIDTFLWVDPADIGKYLHRKEYFDIVIQLLREYRKQKQS